jgi:hypothetical protein
MAGQKAGQKVLRTVAVLSSLVLVGGYVYERAGGGLFSSARESGRDLLPGSKVKTHIIPPTAVFSDSESAPLVSEANVAADQPHNPSSGPRTLLPGSKLPGVVFSETKVDFASPIVPKGAPLDPFSEPPPDVIPSIVPAAQQTRAKRPRSLRAKSPRNAPKDPFAVHERVMLPGSKSVRLIFKEELLERKDSPVEQDNPVDPFGDDVGTAAPEAVSGDDPFSVEPDAVVPDTPPSDDPFNPSAQP